MNYNGLPVPILDYYATGYVDLLRRETTTFLYLTLLSTPSLSIPNTLAVFQVDTRRLVKDIVALALQLERITPSLLAIPDCPLSFDVNVFQADGPARASLQLFHSALRNLLTYIEESNLAEAVAQEWIMQLEQQFDDPAAHTVLPTHPSAVIRRFADITVPFTLERRSVPAWLVLLASPNPRRDVQCQIGDKLLSNNVLYVQSSEFSIAWTRAEGGFAAIPAAGPFTGTFFSLVVSFKYFIHFVAGRAWDSLAQYRIRAYTMFAHAVIADSPFFAMFPAEVLAFIRARIPLSSSDFTAPFIRDVNLLAVYAGEVSAVATFVDELQILYEERVLLSMKANFPAFLTPQDAELVRAQGTREWELPIPWIPNRISKTDAAVRSLIPVLKRVFSPSDTLVGFPFHLFIRLWIDAIHVAPPFRATLVRGSPNIIEVEFSTHRPETVRLFISGGQTATLDGRRISSDCPFPVPPGAFRLELPQSESWSALEWAFLSNPPLPTFGRDFAIEHRDRFADDIRAWQTVLTADIDQEIICALASPGQNPAFSFALDPVRFLQKSLRAVPLHLLLMRGPPLALLNWMAVNGAIDVSVDPSLAHLIDHVSAGTQVQSFLDAVRAASNTRSARETEVSVNRQSAFDVRSGTSTNLANTVISQMARQYQEPARFRRCADDPWSVAFAGERGVDLGGPARELVYECATDLCSPACGLVVPVPNARNGVGDGREWVLPMANPRHADIDQQYRFAGAVIGIALRTGLVQDFAVPPLVWEFLVRRELRIERLYEVDEQHRQLIQSLQEAVRSGLTQAEFTARFNLAFTVVDVTGEERSLTPRGRAEHVTLDNAAVYISLANEYRLN
jgi:hypothetical protein